MLTATATEIQNNFGKYLQLAQEGGEVVVLKNGKEVARLVSYEKSVSYLTDSLVGVLKNDYGAGIADNEQLQNYIPSEKGDK
ncbi:MAG: type II toxin-antitoxin system Phd/YefM family antitoxin [Oscillospiraceae bacterium]|nr:type II toxin-antitoxin system Phd/YefM family antitoxin [Oscillospiraceae bacterium]MCD8116526.1 type II toxin-antitoxin system Phd/YefM family antitoxin [Oscillospiraceae bacterium]